MTNADWWGSRLVKARAQCDDLLPKPARRSTRAGTRPRIDVKAVPGDIHPDHARAAHAAAADDGARRRQRSRRGDGVAGTPWMHEHLVALLDFQIFSLSSASEALPRTSPPAANVVIGPPRKSQGAA